MRNRVRSGALLTAAALAFAGAAGLLSPAADAARQVKTETQNAPAPARGFPDSVIAPLSVARTTEGETALAAGKLSDATDSFESALVVDPRNNRAYIGLARVAEAQGLPGKAVRYYRQALQNDPNDLNILELQGNALLARGAKPRAEENLARLRTLCGTAACPQGDRLAAAISSSKDVGAVAVTSPRAGPTARAEQPQPGLPQ